jgi:tRNA A-37 threonylcarbamoyl transferase component Bud32
MGSTNHPDKTRLIAFHEGRLEEHAIDAVAEHLTTCEPCQRLMDQIEERESSLVQRLRTDDRTLERLPGSYELRLLQAGSARPSSPRESDEMVDGERGEKEAATAPVDPLAVDPLAATLDHAEAQHKTDDGRSPASVRDRYRSSLAAGESFGNYEIVDEIDRGGMGVVYRARQVSANRLVALKVILDSRLGSAESVQRFRVEAEAAAGLDHPGIVSVYDVGEWNGHPYYTMRLIEGGSLQDLLDQGPIDRQRAVEFIQTIARTVHFAHSRNIVHRDLKPANVLLGENEVPLLTDFGLAKDIQSDSQITCDGQIMGTPNYMAPEQASGRGAEVGPLSDVYSLGAILYHLVTNTRPFAKSDLYGLLHSVIHETPRAPHEIDRTIPIDLATICMKCLEKDPAQRYPSAAELADDLARYLRGEPIAARPISSFERIARWSRRNPGAVWGAVVTALVMFVAVVAAAVGLDRQVKVLEQDMDRVSQQSLHETASWVAMSAEGELRQKFRQVRAAAVSPLLRQYLANLVRDGDAYAAAKEALHEQDLAARQASATTILDPPPGIRPIQYWISSDERWEDAQNVLGWWVCGPDGHQLARDPWKASATRDFRFRSYFTGLPQDLPQDSNEPAMPRPIWQPSDGPRLSAVFLTRETDQWVLAISAPVFQDQAFLGVVGIFLRLGSLLERPSEVPEQSEGRYAMLLDPRPDGQTAKIIEHPYHHHASSTENDHLRQEVATVTVTREQWQAKIAEDPFGHPLFHAQLEFGGRWRTAWAPVRIPDGRGQELIALVREREELVSQPSRRLRTNLRWLGIAVAGLMVMPPLIALFLVSRGGLFAKSNGVE